MQPNKIHKGQTIKTLSISFMAILILATPLFFQTSPARMSGKLLYQDKTTVDDAVISVLNASDSSLVTSGITEKDGTFKFEKIETGNYLIAIQVFDKAHKVYGPVTLENDQQHLVLKTLTLPTETTCKKMAECSSASDHGGNI